MQQMTAKLADKTVFNPKYTEYRFELEHPHTMQFQAGQYISVAVAENGDRRSYSLTSNPDNIHGFDLLVDHSPQGVGSQFMQNLQFGQVIQIMGPMGKFVVDRAKATDPVHPEKELVLIATGSGIAPFHAMVLDLLQDQAETRKITLYWGMRHVHELFWQNEFQDLVESFETFSFHPVISQPIPQWTLCQGRVTDCLVGHELPPQAGYYLCGSATMITDVRALLESKGVLPENIHFEKFF